MILMIPYSVVLEECACVHLSSAIWILCLSLVYILNQAYIIQGLALTRHCFPRQCSEFSAKTVQVC